MAYFPVRVFLLVATMLVLLPSLVHGGLEMDLSDRKKFTEALVSEDRALVVKFYSDMCGSCKEFTPTWLKLQTQLERFVVFGAVNIDTKSGNQLAKELGVLDEGLPNVRIFTSRDADDKGVSCLKHPEQATHKHVQASIRKGIMGLQKNEGGFYLKQAKSSAPAVRHEGGDRRKYAKTGSL